MDMRTNFARSTGVLGLGTLAILYLLGALKMHAPWWAIVALAWIGMALCAVSFMASATAKRD